MRYRIERRLKRQIAVEGQPLELVADPDTGITRLAHLKPSNGNGSDEH